MGLFKKKQALTVTELKCPAEGCSFTANDSTTLKKHMDWKHPQLEQGVKKS
jgi:hypothetical protein